MNSAREVLQFVSASPNRVSALQVLFEEGPKDRYELETEMDASRRTVTRTIQSLEEHGFVSRESEGYQLTQLGAFLASTLDECMRNIDLAEHLSPFFRNVPDGLVDVELDRFRDADMLVADQGSPFLLLDRSLELRADARQIREVAPGVERRSIEQLVERIRDGEAVDVGVVLDEKAIAAAESNDTYDSLHQELLDADAVDLYCAAESVPLFVGLFGDTATLIAEKDGRPHAMIETTDDTVYDWAESFYETVKRAASPLDLD